jgi:hypothetical protein
MLESRKAPNEIFRIGRKPDPWQPPDWSRANSDGTFGNRFDDPAVYYRVLYAASQPVSCFVETLARFRPDLTLLAELNEIEGENDFVPLGEVPLEWCDQRLIGTASVDGDYADIYSSAWIAHLRPQWRMNACVSDCKNSMPRFCKMLLLAALANSLHDKPTSLAVLAFTIVRASGMTWKTGPFSSRSRSIREVPKRSKKLMSLSRKRFRFWG